MIIFNNIDAYLKFQNTKVEKSKYFGEGTAYHKALMELKEGSVKNHWKWYIFPNIHIGKSRNLVEKFALKSLKEAEEYLQHPILGKRLIICTESVLARKNKKLTDIFATKEDAERFMSSMELFGKVGGEGSVFWKVLERFEV